MVKVSAFSAAASRESGISDRKRNSGSVGFAKNEYRIPNNEFRMSKECILSIFIKGLS
jgi:hypothetical protein